MCYNEPNVMAEAGLWGYGLLKPGIPFFHFSVGAVQPYLHHVNIWTDHSEPTLHLFMQHHLPLSLLKRNHGFYMLILSANNGNILVITNEQLIS